MPFSTVARNQGLDAITIDRLSLHSSNPGDTGTGEITGGTPAYARQAVTYAAASSGNRDQTGTVAFDVPPATTVKYVGKWLNAGSVFKGWAPVGSPAAPKPFTADASTDVVSCRDHGWSDGQAVCIMGVMGAGVPTGLTDGDIYYVRDSTADTFKLAATAGGTAIDITADGAGVAQACAPETFGSQGTLTLSDTDLYL